MKNYKFILFSLALCQASFGADPKISAELASLLNSSPASVIVQYAHEPTSTNHSRVRLLGGNLSRDLHAGKAAAYSVSGAALSQLSADSEVTHISVDHPVRGHLDYTTAAVNAATAWQSGYTGAGIGVALIDSGMTPTTDMLPARIVYAQSWIGTSALDGYGHGTHVAGIIGGSGAATLIAPSSRRSLQGMAPGVNFIDLRVLDQNGAGKESDVIDAIHTAIALKDKYNIRVINLSLGRPVYESYTVDPLCQAAEAAWKAGIVVVVSAGNDGRDNSAGNQGYGTISAPGNDPYVITVGAMKTEGTKSRLDDLIASYSSKGPTGIDHILKPDLVAPGNQVVSLQVPQGYLSLQYPANLIPLNYISSSVYATSANSQIYFTLSGTSMAAPVVTGAVALMLQQDSALTPDQVKARLMRTAYATFPSSSTIKDATTGLSYVSYYDAFTVGAGYLDVKAALADTTLFNSTAMSPVVTWTQGSDPVILCTTNTVCTGFSGSWSQSNIWRISNVSAGLSVFSLLTNQKSIWGSRTVWGVKSVWGVKTVWGANGIVAAADSTIVDKAQAIQITGEK